MLSINCSTKIVQSLIHLVSPPIAKVPVMPFLLKARISFAPTHLASHTALAVGIFLLRHCSKRAFPLMPCGIVRLSRRNDILGFAKSRSHVSLFVSVKVTRGGGLKVGVDLIWPWARRCERTLVNRDERVCKPVLCFTAGNMDTLAEPVSFCVVWDLSKKPCRIT
jgi:hypothetical protein